jgi:UPF0755 protein
MVRLSLAAALVLGLLAGGCWGLWRWHLDRPLSLAAAHSFQVEKGDGVARIARRLKDEGILAHTFWFEQLARLQGSEKRIKFGEYEIQPNATPRQILELLTAGRVAQHAVTILEGWSFKDVIAALNRHPDLAPEVMGRSPEAIMARLGAPGQAPEGRFFPDTYFVSHGTTDLEVLRRAYAKMTAVLDEEWPKRAPNLPYATPYEALIMASIVEKETAKSEERPQVAGVFTRRLEKKMRLQTDPTVIYGMRDGYGGNIRKSDLRKDTPYNTYTRAGLPPTPIALPGLGAIRAALHPAGGDALYFVARGDGSHVFSATLDAHERAVDQFQRQ